MENFDNTINSLIELAKACSDICDFEPFIDMLKKRELYILHTFLIIMKDSLIRKNKIKINSKFLRFFKMFYNDLVEDKINEEEVERLKLKAKKIIKDFKYYIERNKKVLKFRKIRKSINGINLMVQKIIKKVEVSKEVNRSLKNYVPKNLISIVIMLEELTLSEISK